MKQGITCFNTDLTNKKISEYLYELILSKMDGEEEYFPLRCGFDFFGEKVYFVTSEFCERNGYPPVIEKSFVVELPNDYTSERAEKDFVALAKKHNSKEQFMLLNMMRVSGLFSNILSNRYIEFDKIIFIDGDAEKLTKYLQIYDREYEVIKPYSINVKNDVIKSDIEDKSSDVVIFEDRKTATDFTKKNGVEAINFLRDIIYYDNYNEYADGFFVTVVFSNRLNQLVEGKYALNIDFSGFRSDSEWEDWAYLRIFYFLDDLLVKRVCSNYSDFENTIDELSDRYGSKSKELDISFR